MKRKKLKVLLTSTNFNCAVALHRRDQIHCHRWEHPVGLKLSFQLNFQQQSDVYYILSARQRRSDL